MTKADPSTVVRTPYGERLFKARTHAKLSQRELADRVGFKSQGTIADLEVHGQGSSKTGRMAEVCGVREKWLATGEGPMLDTSEVPPEANTVASERVLHYQVGQPSGTDYRTIALSLAAALEESGTEVTVAQFIKLLEATYAKLQR